MEFIYPNIPASPWGNHLRDKISLMSTLDQPPPKRKRLSYACNYCREKKTRCDEEQPCRNCHLADVECVTTDKRRDGQRVENRRRQESHGRSQSATLLRAQLPPSGGAVSSAQSQTPRTPESHASSVVPTTRERPRIWSQCWGPEGWKTGRLPMMPRFVGSSVLELMTAWLDMAFYRIRGAQARAVSPLLNQSFASVILDQPPELPDEALMQVCVENYWITLHQIFPFLDRQTVEPICNAGMERNVYSNHSSDAPSRALKYLIVTTGMLTIPPSEVSRTLISSCISYCNSLLGHIVTNRSLQSVQVILLFSIVLRSCDKIAWAWDILTMGVSLAQSIGINQGSQSLSDPLTEPTPEFQTWWCIYVFERVLALECGRPSTIWDRQLSETIVLLPQTNPGSGTDPQFRNVLISLANMLHEMQERSVRAWRREEWIPQSVEQSIEDKLQTGGELHVLLSEWQDSLPAEYRPGSASNLAFDSRSQSAFLSYYYNLGLLLVNRSTLLVPKDELHAMVNKYAAGKSWQQRLLAGSAPVIEAARQMIKLFVASVDSGTPTYLTAITSPLAAVYVLAIHIYQERRSLLIRSDFELLKVAIQITKEHYHKHDTASNIDDVLLDVEQFAARCLETPSDSYIDPLHVVSDEIVMGDISLGDTMPTLEGSTWGPSALDWAGWDWNDLSHLFQHTE
ncbi:hypothetical protein N7493_004407 [Penicillium malachiteum]|uniref:Zn(2)-C6 fungal-type domain-containing protein n=1 Tax=Penicillium malachiteum TaxID=1324776 RepID=A0AAD6HNX0_9EURO|nr:hypothetical protein N7493_004407 [Penicillium malachiteum]